MTTTKKPPDLIAQLRDAFSDVIGPDDAGYDEGRSVYLPHHDRRPAAIVRPADANEAAQVIEFSHRIFNLVVAFFVIGTALLAWTRYRPAHDVVLFSTASFIGLFAQVVLGMVTVTSALNPLVSAAHLGLASAVLALVVVNAVMVWNLRSIPVEFQR